MNTDIHRIEASTIYFFGVTTGRSAIHRIFPRWMEILGRTEVRLEGVDLQIHDSREAYRQAAGLVKYDVLALGGVVTTHKIDMLGATRDMFDGFDPYAQVCGEISCIAKEKDRLIGYASDPPVSGLALNALVGKDYFSLRAVDLLCFGAGGSGTALLLNLLDRKNATERPGRFIAVDRSQERLAHLRSILPGRVVGMEVELICSQDTQVNDQVMASLKPGSIVVNATGMGKDTAGSPVSDAGMFPLEGAAWDFNYRGELDFLRQARSQAAERRLTVADGWFYFVRNWAQVITQILHIELTGDLFERLAEIAR